MLKLGYQRVLRAVFDGFYISIRSRCCQEKFFDMLKKHQDIPQVAQKNLLTEDPIELLRDESQKQYAALMVRKPQSC